MKVYSCIYHSSRVMRRNTVHLKQCHIPQHIWIIQTRSWFIRTMSSLNLFWPSLSTKAKTAKHYLVYVPAHLASVSPCRTCSCPSIHWHRTVRVSSFSHSTPASGLKEDPEIWNQPTQKSILYAQTRALLTSVIVNTVPWVDGEHHAFPQKYLGPCLFCLFQRSHLYQNIHHCLLTLPVCWDYQFRQYIMLTVYELWAAFLRSSIALDVCSHFSELGPQHLDTQFWNIWTKQSETLGSWRNALIWCSSTLAFLIKTYNLGNQSWWKTTF